MIALTIICAVLVPVLVCYKVGRFFGARTQRPAWSTDLLEAMNVFSVSLFLLAVFSLLAAAVIAAGFAKVSVEDALRRHTVFLAHHSGFAVVAALITGTALSWLGWRHGATARKVPA